MFEQAAGFAVVAAISPSVIVMALLYLGSRRPGQNTLWFLLGGVLVVTVVGVAALIAIRAGGLSLPSRHQTRYGVRLGLGLLAIAGAVVLALRKPRERKSRRKKTEQGSRKPGLLQRMTADPRPLTAFVVGVVMFGPSLTFLAAVQVVATDKVSLAATAGAMAMIVVLVVSFAWLPLVAYLIAPEPTVRGLKALEYSVRRHRKVILVSAVGLIGVLLTIQGIVGLA